MTIPIFPQHILPSSLNFRIVANSTVARSQNNMSEVWKRPGAIWTFSGTWSRIKYTYGRELGVFIDDLDGSAGQFMMWDSTHKQLGAWSGTLRVDGDDQTGEILSIRGAVPNALIAPAGDRFQLDNYLYKLMEDAVADGDGNCTLRFKPQLFLTPTDSTEIITTNPMCKMMLSDNDQGPSFASRKIILQDFSISGFTSIRR
ncbi:hypothetical protein [Alteromonas sp. C1M14]|uniref:hypothetical protein n=1 Tax=Alteromonas sp. C1M14 TaxID=2841567 RepID=UPI001C09FCD7|nr:hypothetical protein [Alteromonas sp. C1M14]MBU2979003.1 hypothetical protein [Alteromonas sp. C1M14]